MFAVNLSPRKPDDMMSPYSIVLGRMSMRMCLGVDDEIRYANDEIMK